jgi:ribonuclease BN (tRNA processing enzyme)
MRAPHSLWGLSRLLLSAAFFSTVSAAVPAADEPSTPLSVVVLGSGGPGAVGRAASSFLVLVDGTPKILVDAGPGSFARLGETGLSIGAVDTILLTHLHADHAGELPGLVKARAVAVRAPIRFRVFGPKGHAAGPDAAAFPATSRLIDLMFGPQGAFSYLNDFSGHIDFSVKDLAATPSAGATPKLILSESGLEIRAIAGHHRDAPAVIYRIDYHGRSVTFSGDIDAKGWVDLEAIDKRTGLLVFNSVVLDPPAAPPILYTLHTAPADIGRIAQAAGAGQLLLAHLSPATDGNRADVEASIRRSYAGPVIFAEDKARLDP